MDEIPIRRFEFVTIYTRDLEQARQFWVTTLGCKVLRETPKQFLQIEVAGVPICIDPREQGVSGQLPTIGVLVEDLEQTIAALRRKGLDVSSGSKPSSRERWAGVKDSDGNELIFLTHD